MKIAVAFEKRDWGSGKRTWRIVKPTHTKYKKHTKGPSEYTVRILTNLKTKRKIFS